MSTTEVMHVHIQMAETKAQEVQSVVFSKEEGDWTLDKARAWLDDHDLRSDKVDETSQSWRFRQFDPSECAEGSFQTLTENLPAGVSMVSCEHGKRAAAEVCRGTDRLVSGTNRCVVTHLERELVLKGYLARVELKAIDEEKRLVPAMVSMASKDRAGDTIKPEGWELDNYRKNPVVLWGHDYRKPPVGRSVELAVRPEGLYSVTEFADHPLALEIFDLYAMDFMSAWSVGFDPKEWIARFEQVDGKELFTGYDFLRQELLEYSAVSVPMHQDALTQQDWTAEGDDRCVALARAMRKGMFPMFRESLHEVAASPGTPAPADERGILAEIETSVRAMLYGLAAAEITRSVEDLRR